MKDIDIPNLRAFLTVYDEGSFTKAAERLFRTQSAVSMQVKRLEDQLGQKLFLNRRDVSLTDAGLQFIEKGRELLVLHDDIITCTHPNKAVDHIRIGAPDGYAASVLPPALNAIASEFPNLQIKFQCGLSPQLIKEVDAGNLDIALITTRSNSQLGELLTQLPIYWMSATDNPTAVKAQTLPLALFPSGCVFRELAIRALNNIGRPWRIVQESLSLPEILTSVASGQAITALPSSNFSEALHIIEEDAGLPKLGNANIALYRRSLEEPTDNSVITSITNRLRKYMRSD